MKNPCRISLFIALGMVASAAAGEMHIFHSTEGKPLNASFEGSYAGMAVLKLEDGKIVEIPELKLSAEDQMYIKDFALRSVNEAKKLNAAAGHPIADATPFSERKAQDLADALQIRPESESKYGKSWRQYAAYSPGYLLFGAMPYSVALYSNEEGFATSMSIVYANKGDFGSTAGFGKDHFKGGTEATPQTLAEAMNKDDETVNKALSSVLGAGKVQRYGEGDTRRKIMRWDWNGTSFLLSNQEGEYVSLGIVPTTTADAGGKSAMTKDGDVKKRLMASIVKSPNGDVYLTEIPMVNQGPKGYCVPATFERVMRTMGLEADMYLLAMVGQSGAGGGTSVELLLENLRHQVLSKGRRLKEEAVKDLRVRDVRRYIDEGIPVMWTLCSMDEYNAAADKDTSERSKVTDWKARAAELTETYATLAKSKKPDDKHHLCIIIGYNENSQEIAVSDSWGKQFEIRWVPVSVANWASSGRIVMILP